MVSGEVRSTLRLLGRTFVAFLAIGCSSGPILSLGSNEDDARTVDAGTDQFTDGAVDADPAPPLAIRVENDMGEPVDFVTVNCPGDCREVTAVASGGYEPYAFAWEDGTTTSARTVCPAASTTLVVSVTDQGVAGQDFARPPETAQAQLIVEVLDCADGGKDAATIPTCDSVAGDFSSVGKNPHGPWSYGWSTTPGLSFTQFAHFIAPADAASVDSDRADLAVWSISAPDLLAGYRPDVFFNPGAMPVHPGGYATVNAGQFGLHPGPSGEYAIARWTAQSSGSYRVVFTFEGVAGYMGWPVTTTDVRVLHNNTDLTTGEINGNDSDNVLSGASNVDVLAGDFIDFAVGDGGNGFGYDTTALDAVVCRTK